MVIYETDTNRVAVYDSSAWVYKTADVYPKAGSVLQVVSTTKTDTFSTASTTFVDVTGLSVTITPSSIDSKVLVIANCAIGCSTNVSVIYKLTGGAGTYIGDTAGSRTRATGQTFIAGATSGESHTPTYLDSPASISAQTYKLQIAATSGTAFVNRQSTDTDAAGTFRWASSITVMEISA
jgi:hypothetical protein